MKKRILRSSSERETLQIAKNFAKTLKPGSVLAMEGDLGAGKTTFIKGLSLGLGLKKKDEVKSPTFVIMHVYLAKMPIYHFDLYRLDDEKDFRAIGLDEFAHDPHSICCIEWAGKAAGWLPDATHRITLKHRGIHARSIAIEDLKRDA